MAGEETFSNVTPIQETFTNVTPINSGPPLTEADAAARPPAPQLLQMHPSYSALALSNSPSGADPHNPGNPNLNAVPEASRSGVNSTALGTQAAVIGAEPFAEAALTGSLKPLYPLVRAYLGAKAGGYVGKDIGEWIGDQQTAQTGKQIGEVVGGATGAFTKVPIPNKIDLLKKALALFESEGGAAAEGAAASEAAVGPKPPDLSGGPSSFRAGTGAAKKVSASNIADQVVANSTGVKPLEPNVPLREQVPVAKPVTPTTPAQPAPNYAYRVRSQGEEGLPIGGSGSNAAHATTTFEDAQRLAPGRESITGEPQEIVRFDLNGKDHVRIPRDNGPDWVRMNQPLSESDVQRADVNGNFQEAKPAIPKPEAPAATSGVPKDAWQKFQSQSPDSGELGSWNIGNVQIRKISEIPDFVETRGLPQGHAAQAYTQVGSEGPTVFIRGDLTQQGFETALQHELDHISNKDYPTFAQEYPQYTKPVETDPIKLKYPDPAIRQMVRANGENIVQAIGGDKDTMKAVHDLTRVDLRQALINSGEDMGQTTVSNSKFAGEGSITREAAFNRLLEKGLKPSDIVALAKKVPQATTQ